MMGKRVALLLVAACVGASALVAAGCGGGGSSSTAAETTTATTETTTTETTPTTETTGTEATTEATTTEATTTSTTETSAIPNFASSENCRQFALIGAKISSSLSGSGANNLGDVQKAFEQYAAAAPAEIKDDFQTLADWFGKVADALGSLQAGQTPSAADLAKLNSIDSTQATQASQNISTWVAQNCTG
jgi:hypothetical protein